jgi:GNAT superfamily N-acetyltransferase
VTAHAAAELVESNVAAFLLEMGRAGGGDLRDHAEITWVAGGSPLAYHNAVVRCSAPPDRVDALVGEWRSELERRNLPGSWHVAPGMPAEVAARLAAHGFEDAGDEPAMARDLAQPLPVIDAPASLAVARVTDAGALASYGRVLAENFGEGPLEAEWVTRVLGSAGLGDDTPWRHYLGVLDGEPAATVTLYLTPPVAGVYFVCTAEGHRRRGIGAAFTAHALRDARALGCTTAVLGSSPMGYGVYRRLGFEEVFRYRIYEWRPA